MKSVNHQLQNAPHLRAQTILEMMFVLGLLLSMMGISWYLFTAFEVVQKQNMLVRTQAFLELGNYSDFGTKKHGQDDPKSDQSKITFQLGEKAQGTRVDLEKASSFKQAVEGSLQLDIVFRQGSRKSLRMDGLALNGNQTFWEQFYFPRKTTVLDYSALSADSDTQRNFKLTLEQSAFIVHGRTIEPSKAGTFFFGLNNQNEIATGTVEFQEVMQLTQMRVANLKSGMRDNLEDLKDALRGIAKSDPQYAKEAAELEKSVNASEAISGGAVASLISSAISLAIQGVLAGLADLSAAAKGVGEAGAAGGQAGGNLAGLMDKLTGNFTDPFSGAVAYANGGLLAAPIQMAGAIVSVPVHGVENVTKGVANIGGQAELAGTAASGAGAAGAATSSGVSQAAWMVGLKGVSQLGQTAQLGAAIGGKDIQALNQAVVVTSFPSDFDLGLKAISSAWNNPDTSGMPDVLGAVQALPAAVIPATTLVAAIEPDLAKEMAIVNTAVATAAATAGLADHAGALASGETKIDFSTLRSGSETLVELGTLTVLAGTAYAGIAELTNNDPTVGQYMIMGGTAVAATGVAGTLVADLREQGIDLLNPVEAAKAAGEWFVGLPKKNLDNAKQALTESVDVLKTSAKNTVESAKLIFAPGDEKKALQYQYQQGMFEAWDKNLTYHQNSPEFLKDSRLASNDAELATLQARVRGDMATLDKAIKHVKDVQAGRTTKDPAIVQAGIAAGERLKTNMNTWFKDVPLAQRQTKGIYFGNAQAVIAQKAANDGVGRSQMTEMENEARKKNPIGQFFGSLRGGRNTVNHLRKQEDLARDLGMINQVRDQIEQARDAKVKEVSRIEAARNATRIAGRILENAPVWSNDHSGMRDNAAQAASLIENVVNDKSLQIPNSERLRMKDAVRKLNRVSSGDYTTVTSRQVLDSIREELASRERYYQNFKNSTLKQLEKSPLWANHAAFTCAAEGVC